MCRAGRAHNIPINSIGAVIFHFLPDFMVGVGYCCCRLFYEISVYNVQLLKLIMP